MMYRINTIAQLGHWMPVIKKHLLICDGHTVYPIIDLNGFVSPMWNLLLPDLSEMELENLMATVPTGSADRLIDIQGNTIIHYLVRHDKFYFLLAKLIECLLPNLNVLNGAHAKSPLHYAARSPVSLDMMKLLVSCGAEVNLKDGTGITSLHHAILNKAATKDAFDTLVTADNHLNIDLNVQDNEGNSALHYAAMVNDGGHCFRALASAESVDVNVQNVHGNTAAHLILFQSKTHPYVALLNGRFDLSIVNAYGVSANYILFPDGMFSLAAEYIVDPSSE